MIGWCPQPEEGILEYSCSGELTFEEMWESGIYTIQTIELVDYVNNGNIYFTDDLIVWENKVQEICYCHFSNFKPDYDLLNDFYDIVDRVQNFHYKLVEAPSS